MGNNKTATRRHKELHKRQAFGARATGIVSPDDAVVHNAGMTKYSRGLAEIETTARPPSTSNAEYFRCSFVSPWRCI